MKPKDDFNKGTGTGGNLGADRTGQTKTPGGSVGTGAGAVRPGAADQDKIQKNRNPNDLNKK